MVGQLTGLSVYNLALSDGKWQSSRPINRPVGPGRASFVRDSNSLICDDYAQPHFRSARETRVTLVPTKNQCFAKYINRTSLFVLRDYAISRTSRRIKNFLIHRKSLIRHADDMIAVYDKRPVLPVFFFRNS